MIITVVIPTYRRPKDLKSCLEALKRQTQLANGSQIHNDMAFSLSLRKEGWKQIYDPQVSVDHYPGKRFDEDQQSEFNEITLSNIVHNQTLILLRHLSSARQVIFLIWSILLGTSGEGGIVQWLRFLPSEGTLAWRKLIASLQVRWARLAELEKEFKLAFFKLTSLRIQKKITY
jgi:GT2 family glycosyltransferase